jgi:deoxyadenosine/deoxycytidine kinase
MEKQLKLTGDMVARVDEDVERWSDKKDPLDGRNLLEQASDPFGEMGFNFQLIALSSICGQLARARGGRNPAKLLHIMDRGLADSEFVFMTLLSEQGRLNLEQARTYQEMKRNLFACQPIPEPIMYIYLNPGREICAERTLSRGRAGESITNPAEEEMANRRHQLTEEFVRMLPPHLVTTVTQPQTDAELREMVSIIGQRYVLWTHPNRVTPIIAAPASSLRSEELSRSSREAAVGGRAARAARHPFWFNRLSRGTPCSHTLFHTAVGNDYSSAPWKPWSFRQRLCNQLPFDFKSDTEFNVSHDDLDCIYAGHWDSNGINTWEATLAIQGQQSCPASAAHSSAASGQSTQSYMALLAGEPCDLFSTMFSSSHQLPPLPASEPASAVYVKGSSSDDNMVSGQTMRSSIKDPPVNAKGVTKPTGPIEPKKRSRIATDKYSPAMQFSGASAAAVGVTIGSLRGPPTDPQKSLSLSEGKNKKKRDAVDIPSAAIQPPLAATGKIETSYYASDEEADTLAKKLKYKYGQQSANDHAKVEAAILRGSVSGCKPMHPWPYTAVGPLSILEAQTWRANQTDGNVTVWSPVELRMSQAFYVANTRQITKDLVTGQWNRFGLGLFARGRLPKGAFVPSVQGQVITLEDAAKIVERGHCDALSYMNKNHCCNSAYAVTAPYDLLPYANLPGYTMARPLPAEGVGGISSNWILSEANVNLPQSSTLRDSLHGRLAKDVETDEELLVANPRCYGQTKAPSGKGREIISYMQSNPSVFNKDPVLVNAIRPTSNDLNSTDRYGARKDSSSI